MEVTSELHAAVNFASKKELEEDIKIGGSWASELKVEVSGKVEYFSVPIQNKFCLSPDRCAPYAIEPAEQGYDADMRGDT
jgi:hypothetical protein